MLNIHVSNMIHIPMDNPVYENILERIRERFTYNNPIFHEMKKRGYNTHGTDPYVHNWTFSLFDWVKHLSIPRGAMVWLKQFLNENNIPFTVRDNRSSGIQFEVEWNEKYNPHDYQLIGASLLSKYQQGFWCYNPGAGKTVLGLYCIAQEKTSTLIIVNSNELANQWETQIRKFLKYDHQIGRLQQNIKNIRAITIALMQSLMNWDENKLSELNDHFGFLIHDEAHHSPAEGNQKVLNCLSQKYRMALTASTTRKDNLEFIAYDYYDKIRQRETGKVMIPTVEQINTGTSFNWHRGMKWTQLEKKLTDDVNRNDLIRATISEDVLMNHRVLALFSRNEAAKNMTKLLQNDGIKVRCLISGIKMDLDEIKRDCNSGRIQVIVACKMFDEGIDIPILSSVHLCSPSSNKEGIRQRTGRVTRTFPNKMTPRVIDYRDDVQPCKASALKRLEWYREFGYNISGSFINRVKASLW